MKSRSFVLILGALLIASRAGAAATDWQSNPQGRVRLISATHAVSGGDLPLGVQFQPTPGWYLYWKDPGEAGIPPRVDWAHSQGLANPRILFPMPTKIVLPGDIVEYGYEGETVYPVRAISSLHGTQIRAKLSYLTCNTSCIPYTYTFALDLPANNKIVEDPEESALLQKFIARVPPESATDADIKAKAPVEHKNPGEAAAVAGAIWGMLVIAFVGGLLLNVMPCVLPVLSIKLTGLLQHSGQSARNVVKSALASAAGILVSFEALALIAITARRAGHAIGWGIQFQNPLFVVFLLVIVLLFAFNLWGIFEIPMPRWAGHFATTYGYHETLPAHFVSGLFATLLATPCSAPFLGTAMGFALAQPSGTILAIFFAVGTGMALPYLILAGFPKSIVWLPKPGAWMVNLKKALSILLLVTAAWLGWVLVMQLKPPAADTRSAGDASTWEKFDEATIDRHLAAGQPVFVDVTADWCVTCKYNERFVLNDRTVVEELKRQNVVLMKADWTNRDAAIGSYLMKNGRAGIPFYAFYRPGKLPVLLSEFLTTGKVLAALKD